MLCVWPEMELPLCFAHAASHAALPAVKNRQPWVVPGCIIEGKKFVSLAQKSTKILPTLSDEHWQPEELNGHAFCVLQAGRDGRVFLWAFRSTQVSTVSFPKSSPMKPARFRPPSPTVTSFSGISNYCTEYKNPVPAIDYVAVSKIHFNELSFHLAAYLIKAKPNSRSTARQKLTHLTIKQFHEVSTDLYDELVRRKNEMEGVQPPAHYVAVPFLPFREEFHPKHNQARQKLATLSISRFEKFSSDVYFELNRRYPEFQESCVIALFRHDLPLTSFPSHRKHGVCDRLFCCGLLPTSFPSHRELYVIALFRHELLLISFRFYPQVDFPPQFTLPPQLDHKDLIRRLAQLQLSPSFDAAVSILEDLPSLKDLDETTLHAYRLLFEKSLHLLVTSRHEFADIVAVMSTDYQRVHAFSLRDGPPFHKVDELVMLLLTEIPWDILLRLDSPWLVCISEIMQMVLDDIVTFPNFELEMNDKLRRRCLAGIRKIARSKEILPPRIFIHTLKRQGKNAVAGGGYAVRRAYIAYRMT
ncbi:hypothetical protein B0H13DRAFT_2449046 [Mycena leptocephala]|nr:hypothetical protein B0H13DRAFT_2449046 [Mycena leptocephala]